VILLSASLLITVLIIDGASRAKGLDHALQTWHRTEGPQIRQLDEALEYSPRDHPTLRSNIAIITKTQSHVSFSSIINPVTIDHNLFLIPGVPV
jgi:hypothetical protein